MSKENKTLTVSELIACLGKFPPDMPVLAEWEGVHTPVDAECIEIELYGPWNGEKTEHLIMHVDQP